MSAGFSPVLAGAASTDSLGTNHTDRERHRNTNHSYVVLYQHSQSVWDSQPSPRQQVAEKWSHLDCVQGKTPTTLIPNKLMNLKAIHYVYSEDVCTLSSFIIYTHLYNHTKNLRHQVRNQPCETVILIILLLINDSFQWILTVYVYNICMIQLCF